MYGSSQFLPIFSLLFFVVRKRSFYIFFLDWLERKSICPLVFPGDFPGVEPLGLHDLFTDSSLVHEAAVEISVA